MLGQGRGRHTASLRVAKKKSTKMSTNCWKPGVCWHINLEWLGEFAHTDSFYLWAYTGCSEDKTETRASDGKEIPAARKG